MNDIIVRIRFQLPSLPRAEKTIASAILENPEEIGHMTVAKLANETESSEAAVIRFCKRIGYSGFTEFKNDFVTTYSAVDDAALVSDNIDSEDDMQEILKKVFQSNIQTLTDTLALATPSYNDALEAMLKANKINFYGVGDAYVVCLLANMKLCRMGVNSSAHSDVVLQLNSAAELKPGDVAFAISYEGRSKNVLEAIRIAKSKGATVICVTKMNKSPLVKLSDIVLYISTNDLTVGQDKVLRRVADQAIVDALIVGMTIRKPREYRPHIKMVQEAIDCNKVK